MAAPMSPQMLSEADDDLTRFEELLMQLKLEHQRVVTELKETKLQTWKRKEGGRISRRSTQGRGSSAVEPNGLAEELYPKPAKREVSNGSSSKGGLTAPFRQQSFRRGISRSFEAGDELCMREEWMVMDRQTSTAEVTPTAFRIRMTSLRDSEASLMHSSKRCLPISPNATWKMYWDLVGIVCLGYDMIFVPMLVFDLPDNLFMFLVDWFILLFWSVDIVLCFLQGYIDKDELILDYRQIAKNYVRTWFPLDCIIVLPDWILRLDSGGKSSFQRLLRSARFMRVLRLLRVVKLQRFMNKVYDTIDNEMTFMTVELVQMGILIVAVNHLLACGWFLMGKIGNDMGRPSWIGWATNGQNYWDEAVGYQYATSLHWSLTQFTPASMDVVARNIFERVYSITILFFAMFAFSSIVGTITASITTLRGMTNDKQRAFWVLRRYLKQKGITKDLQQRMTKFLEHRIRQQERMVPRNTVRLLNEISDQLASELAHEMWGRSLKEHPFFRYLSREMEVVAFRICKSALQVQSLAYMDILFQAGEDGMRTFIMNTEGMRYYHHDPELDDQTLKRGDWVAEAVLWTGWWHRGECIAVSPCEVLGLGFDAFVEIMSAQWRPLSFGQRYGAIFIEMLNSIPCSKRCDVIRPEDVDLADAVLQAQQQMEGREEASSEMNNTGPLSGSRTSFLEKDRDPERPTAEVAERMLEAIVEKEERRGRPSSSTIVADLNDGPSAKELAKELETSTSSLEL